MAKRSILQKNNHKLSAPNDIDDQIFKYLISKKNHPATQVEIANALGVDESTISRHIRPLFGKRQNYGSFYYHIERIGNDCFLIKTPKYMDDEKRNEEIKSTNERISLRIADLAEKNVCLSNSAQIIPLVIFYEIKKKYISDVITALNSTFNPDIFLNIVPVENGIYIMLKNQSDQQKLEGYKQKISQFYQDIYNEAKWYNLKRIHTFEKKKSK